MKINYLNNFTILRDKILQNCFFIDDKTKKLFSKLKKKF